MKMETEITVLVKGTYNDLKKELEKNGFQIKETLHFIILLKNCEYTTKKGIQIPFSYSPEGIQKGI